MMHAVRLTGHALLASCLLCALGCPGADVPDAAAADAGALDDAPVDAQDAGASPDALADSRVPEPGDAGDDAAPPPEDPAATDYWGATGVGSGDQELVAAIHRRLASSHDRVGYDRLFESFEVTDANREGCDGIYDFYSSRCWQSDERCGNFQSEGDCFNREHTWPNSWWGGGGATPAYSDLFQVVPADGYVNNRRGSLAMGEVATSRFESSNGSRVGPCADRPSLDCFEPTASLRGDLARVYFYMAVRYEGELDCCDGDVVNRADLKPWLETTLRRWHDADPVDDAERRRNAAVFELQGNRNPFVDYPAWVARISDF